VFPQFMLAWIIELPASRTSCGYGRRPEGLSFAQTARYLTSYEATSAINVQPFTISR